MNRARLRMVSNVALCAIVASILAIGNGSAASTTVVVAMTIPSATYLDPTNCATGQAGRTDFGTVVPGDSAVTTTDCSVVFGSSNDTAMLRMFQADGAGSAMWRMPTGALDLTFGGGDGISELDHPNSDNIYDVAVGPDGRPSTIGEAWAGAGAFATSRWTTTGAPDVGFDSDGMATYHPVGDDTGIGLAVQPDGKVIDVGYSDAGVKHAVILRYRTDGTLDPSFGTGGVRELDLGSGVTSMFQAVEVLPDGDLLAAGMRLGPPQETIIARFNSDGSLDTDFGAAHTGWTFANLDPSEENGEEIVVLDDGSFIVGGRATGPSGYAVRLSRWTSAGILDTSFGTSGSVEHDTRSSIYGTDAVYVYRIGLDVQASGRIVVAADRSNGVDTDFVLAGFTAGGILDGTFGPGGQTITSPSAGNDVATDLVVQPDGRILVSGLASNGANKDVVVLRYSVNGQLDTSFGTSGTVTIAGASTANYGMNARIATGVDGRYVVAYRDTASRSVVAVFSSLPVAQFAGGSSDWSTAAPNDGFFGACLRSVSGGAATDGTTWTADTVNANCGDGNADPWRPVPPDVSSGAKVAHSGSSTNELATVNLRFGFRVRANAIPGVFSAPLVFQVVAPNA